MAYSSTKPANGTSLVSADIRENFRALKEDGIVVATNASVTQAKLKTSTHEQSHATTTPSVKTLTYADYGFNCRIKSSRVGGAVLGTFDRGVSSAVGTSYVGEQVTITGGIYSSSPYVTSTIYVIYRYVTSSGEVFWVWLLRDRATGKITDADCCSDHCGWGLEDPNDRPHPFPVYAPAIPATSEMPAIPEVKGYDPDKHEILLFNPTPAELTEILAKKTKNRSVLQIILEDYEVNETAKRVWPSIPVTFDLEDDNWEEKLFTGKPAKIKQAVIKKVPYVKMVGMKVK